MIVIPVAIPAAWASIQVIQGCLFICKNGGPIFYDRTAIVQKFLQNNFVISDSRLSYSCLFCQTVY